jgi:polar amino acid transport system ATP-binding protein
MPDTDSLVRLSNVHLAFGDTPVLNGIDISVRRGEAVSIIGPSAKGIAAPLNWLTG